MTTTGELRRRVQFRQRTVDANGSRTGAWAVVVTRNARVQHLRGGEAVQASRMAGEQPVIITVRRDSVTKTIDNAFAARDARNTAIVWDITSATISEDLTWVEILAIQRVGGDDDE